MLLSVFYSSVVGNASFRVDTQFDSFQAQAKAPQQCSSDSRELSVAMERPLIC